MRASLRSMNGYAYVLPRTELHGAAVLAVVGPLGDLGF